jgi:hypothetical protein
MIVMEVVVCRQLAEPGSFSQARAKIKSAVAKNDVGATKK